ncbi:hypothetical protein [Lacisediminihabitans sp. H27-G8]|uniref:hypothetical protein n=1 Tax=Lacisediminihabitans sp. H27-G8 TaxID=3111909 RepID=UPI0038FD1A23
MSFNTTLHLGYFASGVLFTVLIAIPALGYRFARFNPVFAFWVTYIITRPLGASFADWMGVSHARGGLQWGTGPVSIALAVLITVGVAIITVRERRSVQSFANS